MRKGVSGDSPGHEATEGVITKKFKSDPKRHEAFKKKLMNIEKLQAEQNKPPEASLPMLPESVTTPQKVLPFSRIRSLSLPPSLLPPLCNLRLTPLIP